MKTTGFRSMTSVLALAATCSLAGCASLQSVSVTAVPSDRSHEVKADEDNVAFLGIHFSNGFADELRDRLMEQCPHGKVTGIYSKYETFWYVLVERRKVSATGYCVPGETPARTPAKTPREEHAERTGRERDAS